MKVPDGGSVENSQIFTFEKETNSRGKFVVGGSADVPSLTFTGIEE